MRASTKGMLFPASAAHPHGSLAEFATDRARPHPARHARPPLTMGSLASSISVVAQVLKVPRRPLVSVSIGYLTRWCPATECSASAPRTGITVGPHRQPRSLPWPLWRATLHIWGIASLAFAASGRAGAQVRRAARTARAVPARHPAEPPPPARLAAAGATARRCAGRLLAIFACTWLQLRHRLRLDLAATYYQERSSEGPRRSRASSRSRARRCSTSVIVLRRAPERACTPWHPPAAAPSPRWLRRRRRCCRSRPPPSPARGSTACLTAVGFAALHPSGFRPTVSTLPARGRPRSAWVNTLASPPPLPALCQRRAARRSWRRSLSSTRPQRPLRSSHRHAG